MSRKSRYWIQKAVKHPGSLKSYVKRKYGSRGFTVRNGKPVIKVEVLKKLAEKPGTVGRRARLALTLRKLARR